MREGGDIPVASPILAGDLAILTSGHGKYRPLRAVRLNATGDITPREMAATNRLAGISLSTPAISENVLFFRTTEKMLAVGSKSETKPIRFGEPAP